MFWRVGEKFSIKVVGDTRQRACLDLSYYILYEQVVLTVEKKWVSNFLLIRPERGSAMTTTIEKIL